MGSQRSGCAHRALALLFIGVRVAQASVDSIWVINIDNNPAPPPELGAPLSYNAVRDPAWLPYEILGIVAGYVGFVLLTGTLLLTVGRKLRQKARRMIDCDPNDTEMTKPMASVMDPSPLTYRSRHAWGATKKNGNGSTVTVSPLASRGEAFDTDIIARDRNNLQAGLADIYNAVYAAEDSRASPMPLSPQNRPTDLRVTTDLSPTQQPPMQISNQGPGHQTRGSVTNFSKPMSPTVSEYPYAMDGRAGSSDRLNLPRHAAPQPGARGYEDDIEETLPPQYYFEPTPELPSAQTPEIHGVPPTMPATAFDWNNAYQAPVNGPRAWPQPSPQRPAPPMETLTEEASLGSPQTPSRELRTARSAGNVHNTLPLRQQSRPNLRNNRVNDLRIGSRPDGGLLSPGMLSPGMLSPGMPSPGPILSRTLNMPEDSLMRSFPTGLRTPLTGSLMSMQSQFKQFNRAETRSERKQREKEYRDAYGAIPEDLVADDEDMWASSY